MIDPLVCFLVGLLIGGGVIGVVALILGFSMGEGKSQGDFIKELIGHLKSQTARLDKGESFNFYYTISRDYNDDEPGDGDSDELSPLLDGFRKPTN